MHTAALMTYSTHCALGEVKLRVRVEPRTAKAGFLFIADGPIERPQTRLET